MGSGIQVRWLALDRIRDNSYFVLGREEKMLLGLEPVAIPSE